MTVMDRQPATSKALVEKFLSIKLAELPQALEEYCAPDMKFSSPLKETSDLAGFTEFLNETRWQFSELSLTQVFVDGQEDVCAVYIKHSINPRIGAVVFTDIFHVNEGKIKSISSNFNAKPLIESLCEI
jgi:hypothetical protein